MQDGQESGVNPAGTVATCSASCLVTGFIDEWKKIVVHPHVFFEQMPTDGGMTAPIKFYIVIAAVNSVFSLLLNLPKGIMTAIFTGVGSVIIIPLWSFAHAGIVLGLCRLLGGKGSYEATYRACTYSAAPGLLAWLPIVNFFAGFYSLFLQKLALEHAHQLSSAKATAVVAIQVAFVIAMVIISALTLTAALMTRGAAGAN